MTFRKLLSGILASTILLSAVSFSAFAADGAEEPVQNDVIVSEEAAADSVTDSVTEPDSDAGADSDAAPETETETPEAPADDSAASPDEAQPPVNDGSEDEVPPAEDVENGADASIEAPEAEAVPAPQTLELLAAPEPKLFKAYTPREGIVVIDPDTNEEISAYCYNLDLHTPGSIDPNTHKLTYTLYTQETWDGQDPTDHEGTLNPELSARVKRLMYAGYPYDSRGLQNTHGLDNEMAHLYTQNVLWALLGQYPYTPAFFGYAKDLWDFACSDEAILPEGGELEVIGDATVEFDYVTGVDGVYRSSTRALRGFSGVFEISAPEGVRVVDSQGAERNTFKTGELFGFETADLDLLKSGTGIAFAVSSYEYTYPEYAYFYRPYPDDGKYQNLLSFSPATKQTSSSQEFRFTITEIDTPDGPVTPGGVYTVNKVDGANAPLEGASFHLYRMENETKLYATVREDTLSWNADEAEATVFSGSTFALPRLPYGTYYLHEFVTPDGYLTLNGDIKFEVSGDDTLTVVNEKKPGSNNNGDRDDDDDDDDDRSSGGGSNGGGKTPEVDIPDAKVPQGDAPAGDAPIITIEDGETPLADAPELPVEIVELPDAAVPKTDAAPKTGDTAPVLPLLALLLASISGGALLISRKKA